METVIKIVFFAIVLAIIGFIVFGFLKGDGVIEVKEKDKKEIVEEEDITEVESNPELESPDKPDERGSSRDY